MNDGLIEYARWMDNRNLVLGWRVGSGGAGVTCGTGMGIRVTGNRQPEGEADRAVKVDRASAMQWCLTKRRFEGASRVVNIMSRVPVGMPKRRNTGARRQGIACAAEGWIE